MNQKTVRIESFDERRNLVIPGDQTAAIHFATEQFIAIANNAIAERQFFNVALSGGSTPKAIYQLLAQPPYRKQIDWKQVRLFWSDERCVSLTHPDSNYRMAMEAGFSTLPIPSTQVFPLHGEGDLDKNARDYEQLIHEHVPEQAFDLVMLGMGEDGHTASLFPRTHALHTEMQLVIPNYLPEKDVWRMTFTFRCINRAHHCVLYVLGAGKASMVKRVLLGADTPDNLPVQRVGTPIHKALWVLDKSAAAQLEMNI